MIVKGFFIFFTKDPYLCLWRKITFIKRILQKSSFKYLNFFKSPPFLSSFSMTTQDWNFLTLIIFLFCIYLLCSFYYVYLRYSRLSHYCLRYFHNPPWVSEVLTLFLMCTSNVLAISVILKCPRSYDVFLNCSRLICMPKVFSPRHIGLGSSGSSCVLEIFSLCQYIPWIFPTPPMYAWGLLAFHTYMRYS